jgi:hypothetical protein
MLLKLQLIRKAATRSESSRKRAHVTQYVAPVFANFEALSALSARVQPHSSVDLKLSSARQPVAVHYVATFGRPLANALGKRS